jgi:hypothetical protein
LDIKITSPSPYLDPASPTFTRMQGAVSAACDRQEGFDCDSAARVD